MFYLWVMQLKEYIDDTEDLINIKLVMANEHVFLALFTAFQLTVRSFEDRDNPTVVYVNRAMYRTS